MGQRVIDLYYIFISIERGMSDVNSPYMVSDKGLDIIIIHFDTLRQCSVQDAQCDKGVLICPFK